MHRGATTYFCIYLQLYAHSRAEICIVLAGATDASALLSRIYRLYREEGLTVDKRRARRRALWERGHRSSSRRVTFIAPGEADAERLP
jgi:hypothetical protein